MNVADVRKLKHPLDRLVYWITERESVRRKKELGLPRPWTDDEILNTYRFCNVRRMDDKVSRWLLTNWYRPYKNHPNMVVAATLARQLNRIETLEVVGFPAEWNPRKVLSVLNDRGRRGLKNFSAAYMITGTLGGTKAEQVVNKVVGTVYRKPPPIDGSSMRLAAESLVPYPGFSHFMAGQVVADLRWACTGKWADRHEWAPKGPGSRRGLNFLAGRDWNAPMNLSQFNSEFTDVLTQLKSALPTDITKRLEAHDYQNCLCEIGKYSKALLGLGRPKQLYRPEGTS